MGQPLRGEAGDAVAASTSRGAESVRQKRGPTPSAGKLRTRRCRRCTRRRCSCWSAVLRQDVRVTSSLPVAGTQRPMPGAVLEAVLERITYANEETGYTIARVATGRSGTDLLTVVGSLLGVQPGESVRLVGRWG